MTHRPSPLPRRAVLEAAAGLTLAHLGLGATAAAAPAPPAATPAPASPPRPQGKLGDFDFLAGSWRISHRRLKAPGGKAWDTFAGEATVWTVLGGLGSIEELRIPARKFAGIGIRLLDLHQALWNDYWVSGRDGVLAPPGQTGAFDRGVGTFTADDTDDGKPIKVRGVWDRITPTSCRWYQGTSRDGGKTWEDSWFMDWVRA